MAMELVCWLLLVLPGVFYSIWRLTTRSDVCPTCDSPELLPAQSPAGVLMAKNLAQGAGRVEKVSL
jgi:hypothetical protein